MLKVDHITKKFGSVSALNDVSLVVQPGEIFALIGPNGSGKTTMIKLIAGLLRPDAGLVTVADADTVKDPIRAKSAIGYIPDEPVVWSGMTGGEYLHITGALYGMEEEARTRRINEMLALFGLGSMETAYFDDYSRGNKQKFTIMAALMHDPKLLLIDEPIVGLDPSSAAIAKGEFQKFARSGGAALLTTHTLTVAEEIATRIGILVSGRLAGSGTMEELRRAKNLPSGASLEDIYGAFAMRNAN
ncbi:MAG: ABC transporter ATP-binding protein [Patescibacteria group bacterium]